MSFHGPLNTYVSQVHLRVRSLERSQDFYQNMLGLRILEQDHEHITFTANGNDPLITAEQPDHILPHRARAAGLYHFALLLPSRKDLAAALAHLLRDQYPLQGGADHAVSEAVYLADPDGNGIELYRDRNPQEWTWIDGRVHMPTEAMDEHILNELDGEPWTGIPEQTIIGHIHLQVADLKAAESFYCDALGFDLVAQYGNQADFISTGGYHHHIGLNIWNSKGIPAIDEIAAGMKYFTLVYPDQEKRAEAIAHVRARGFSISERTEGVCVKDPSNISIMMSVQA